MLSGVLAAIILNLLALPLASSYQGVETTEQPGLREKVQRENEVWKTLDRDTRRVLATRASYIFRVNDDLIIDAYDLMYWRDRLEMLLHREHIQEYKQHNGFRTKESLGYEWKYLSDEEFDAYFEVPSFGAIYWLDGALVNDRSQWSSVSYGGLRSRAGVHSAAKEAEIQAIEQWIRDELPRVVAVDPLAQADPEKKLYQKDNNGTVRLVHGVMGSGLGRQVRIETPQSGELRRQPGDLSSTRRGVSIPLPMLSGQDVRDGVPDERLDTFLLLPASVSGGAALGPAARQPSGVFEVTTLKRYKLSPKELAVLWIDGALEIPYRSVERNGSDWVCEELLLERP